MPWAYVKGDGTHGSGGLFAPAIVMQSAHVCVREWCASVRVRVLRGRIPAGVLQNSVSFDGKVGKERPRLAAQVPARRAIDRNQNGPSWAELGEGSSPSRMLSSPSQQHPCDDAVAWRLITASKQIRLKLMRRFAFIRQLAGAECNCWQTYTMENRESRVEKPTAQHALALSCG